jgi:hypothetical protein
MERPALRGRSNPTNGHRSLNRIKGSFSRFLDALGPRSRSPQHVVAQYAPAPERLTCTPNRRPVGRVRMTSRRLTVQEAAEVLASVDAVRMRVRRREPGVRERF